MSCQGAAAQTWIGCRLPSCGNRWVEIVRTNMCGLCSQLVFYTQSATLDRIRHIVHTKTMGLCMMIIYDGGWEPCKLLGIPRRSNKSGGRLEITLEHKRLPGFWHICVCDLHPSSSSRVLQTDGCRKHLIWHSTIHWIVSNLMGLLGIGQNWQIHI